MAADYHSALHPVARPCRARQVFVGRHGVAFVWDLERGLPETMGGGGGADTNVLYADVLYADLPWKQGYDKFAARAGVAPRLAYKEFLWEVGAEMRRSGKPAVLVAGKQAGAYLQADIALECRLNRAEAVAYLWGDIRLAPGNTMFCGLPLRPGMDTVAILELLAGRFAVVGDPCCGYGRAGRLFVAAGKRYVLSDFNAECIGHIATHEGSWAVGGSAGGSGT